MARISFGSGSQRARSDPTRAGHAVARVRSALVVVVAAFWLLAAIDGHGGTRRRAVRHPSSAVIERVSVTTDGAEWGLACEPSAISADGRHVAFSCYDPRVIVGNPPLNPGDVWIHDRATGETVRVSDGAPGPSSAWPGISADGRVIVFMSGDRVVRDVYVRDRNDGTLTELLVGRTQPVPRVSGDGQILAFANYAGDVDLWIYDRRTGKTTYEAPTSSRDPAVDHEGRFVAFTSFAVVDAGDTNAAADVFVLDRAAAHLERMPDHSSEGEKIAAGTRPAISANGRFVVFEGRAHGLDGVIDLFAVDRLTGEMTRVSVGIDGAQANGDSYLPSVSAGGRYVAFGSQASNLVAGDTNRKSDVFVRDLLTGRTIRISIAADGGQGDGHSSVNDAVSQGTGPSISADGRYVVFSSSATNLVSNDGNGQPDIFVAPTGFEADQRR